MRSTTFRLVLAGRMLADREIAGLLSVLLLSFQLPGLGKGDEIEEIQRRQEIRRK